MGWCTAYGVNEEEAGQMKGPGLLCLHRQDAGALVGCEAGKEVYNRSIILA